jgi:hypothetical protein
MRRAQVTSRFAHVFRTLEGCSVLLAVVFMIAHPTNRNAHGILVGLAVVFMFYAAVCEVLARRYAGRGLLMSADGIVVRNLWSARRISVEDAGTFSPGVPAGMNGPCPILKRRTGSSVGVGGLAVAAFRWRCDTVLRDLEPLCQRLNATLADLKHDADR